jgi:hypothetical protein
MAANTAPIFSKSGAIEGGGVLTTAAADYTGVSINNQFVFDADEVNGSFLQKLRFKALGTNVATVARIYVNHGSLNQSSTISAVSGTPTGTPSSSGGTLATGNYYAKIQPVDQWGGVPNAGQMTSLSTETAAVSVTGPTGSITWNWTAVTGAVKYRIFVAPVSGGQYAYFESTTNSFVQTTPYLVSGTDIRLGNPQDYIQNQAFIGEISLPATTASASAATPDIDYPMNMVIPAGHRVLVGLGTTVAAGWVVTGIGGNY